MFVSGVLPILLCCVMKLSVARRTGAEDGETVEKINSARCTSRCLTLHITQLTSAFRRLQSDDVLGWCENHRRCAQCLQPCKELWETRRVLPHKFCEHHECVTSAEFLQSLQMQKQGDCPSPQRASGFAAACVESCSADSECSGAKKCCSNGCGHTCQAPTNLYKGVPLKPRKDMAFIEDQHGQLEVTWMSKFNVSIEPVLYILQRRWNHGIHPSEDEASPWRTVLMTMEERALLQDVRPHRWYQFRVSAVNSQGTRGFTTPSKHFFSARDPLPPERPQNISAANQTVSADGRVSVLLRWDPPREGDLLLNHYKVTWSGPGGKESSRVADGTLAEMELGGLQPDTHYMVNIQAVSFWGQKRLKSSRAQFSFKTAASTAGFSPVTGDFSNELPISRSSPRVLRLEAAAPHYHNNQVQVKVFWKSRISENHRGSTSYLLSWLPEVCANNVTKRERTATVQGTHFVITGLLFACKYKVTVTPLSEQGEKARAVTSVTTPQCSMLKGHGKKLLSCAQDERHLQAKKALQRPEKLLAEFQTVNGSLEGLFSWKVSETAPGQTPITGFQFSWVKISSRCVNNSPDTLISHTLNLAPDQHSVRVEQLQPKCVYKVQVQALSEAGSGSSVAKMINTPQLNGTPL
ncbi:anosmin-1b isoform X3 [Tachysurus fulvidraco]|uniref:anosmin-1b isoform X3 n=1 Tax=Tachysurus fulvidraco TaxID=1234273 RepID=UPI001FEE42DB|nr:anosmin-1b isoform X3 [Tachysurus fulvidraco]